MHLTTFITLIMTVLSEVAILPVLSSSVRGRNLIRREVTQDERALALTSNVQVPISRNPDCHSDCLLYFGQNADDAICNNLCYCVDACISSFGESRRGDCERTCIDDGSDDWGFTQQTATDSTTQASVSRNPQCFFDCVFYFGLPSEDDGTCDNICSCMEGCVSYFGEDERGRCELVCLPVYKEGGMCLPRANKVKLQSTIAGNPIQMFEFEVISNSINVALGKTATQSADFKGNTRFSASRAVDGNANTFSHTRSDNCAWWTVDLGGTYTINSIKILNRYCIDPTDPSGCLCRLSHAVVSLLDENGQWVDTKVLGDTCGELELTQQYERANVCKPM